MKDIQLIFDFDDTLVITNPEYEKTNMDTAKIVAKAVYNDDKKIDEILKFQRKEDVEMVKKYGLARPRFLLSWFSTYQHFSVMEGKEEDESVKSLIEKCVNDVFKREFKTYPYAIETLKFLKEAGYPIVILTAGEDEIQRNRIKMAGIDHYVDDIYIRLLKTPETLKEVMNMNPAKDYVMIGNSLKSDIYPALENNIWGFHVERSTWELDHYNIDKSHPKYIQIQDVKEVPEKLNLIHHQMKLSV